MGLVKVNGETFKDRRTNGARLKMDIGDWWKVGSVIIILILAGGNLKWTVNNHTEVLAKQETQVNVNTQKLAKTENEITNIKENLLYIRGKIDTLVLKIK